MTRRARLGTPLFRNNDAAVPTLQYPQHAPRPMGIHCESLQASLTRTWSRHAIVRRVDEPLAAPSGRGSVRHAGHIIAFSVATGGKKWPKGQ